MMDVSSRNKSIDFLKAIAIFFVIYGHSISHIDIGQKSYWYNYQYKFIYIFHMPLFIFISGYLLKIKREDKIVQFVTMKAKRLIVPAMVMTPFVWFAEIIFHKNAEINIVKKFITFAIFDFWYLKCLFVCSVLVFLIEKYLKNKIWLLLLLPIMITNIISLPYYVNFMYPFFILGYLMKNKILLLYKQYKIFFCCIFSLVFILAYSNWNYETYMYNNAFVFLSPDKILLNTLIRFAGGISAIIVLLIISRICINTNWGGAGARGGGGPGRGG
jgi:fucose 4-O-acetylase-like acetyltransferase